MIEILEQTWKWRIHNINLRFERISPIVIGKSVKSLNMKCNLATSHTRCGPFWKLALLPNKRRRERISTCSELQLPPFPIDASHAYETRNIYEGGATAKALYEAIKTGAAAEQQFKFASKQFCAILADSSWMSRLSELAFGFNGALPPPQP